MTTELLVTGSAGLLGHALQRQHEGAATWLTKDDADLRDEEATLAVFRKHKPKKVIHCAALVGGVENNLKHPATFMLDNLRINLNVLEAARQTGVESLVCFLSTCVFPDKTSYPLKASGLHDGPPHPSNYGYAYAKRMMATQVQTYRDQWGINYSVLIPANMYGPNDNFSLDGGHVIPALIHRCMLAGQSGDDFTVWGSGSPLREFVYVDDVARIVLWALDHHDGDEPLIVSSGKEISIRDVVNTIVEAMNFEGNLAFDSTKPDGQYRKPSDPAALRNLLPDFKFTPFKTGIDQMVQWFLANYPNVRK